MSPQLQTAYGRKAIYKLPDLLNAELVWHLPSSIKGQWAAGLIVIFSPFSLCCWFITSSFSFPSFCSTVVPCEEEGDSRGSCCSLCLHSLQPSISKSEESESHRSCSPLFSKSAKHRACTRQHMVRSSPSSTCSLNSAYLFHEENILVIHSFKISWVSWFFHPLLTTARESYCSLMLPVKDFSACQKEIKFNSHWCLAFHGNIQDFTGFGPVKWCSASTGVVVTVVVLEYWT